MYVFHFKNLDPIFIAYKFKLTILNLLILFNSCLA